MPVTNNTVNDGDQKHMERDDAPSIQDVQDPRQDQQESAPTLTDHLNKKLLQSFLGRIDELAFAKIPSNQESDNTLVEQNDFS